MIISTLGIEEGPRFAERGIRSGRLIERGRPKSDVRIRLSSSPARDQSALLVRMHHPSSALHAKWFAHSARQYPVLSSQ